MGGAWLIEFHYLEDLSYKAGASIFEAVSSIGISGKIAYSLPIVLVLLVGWIHRFYNTNTYAYSYNLRGCPTSLSFARK